MNRADHPQVLSVNIENILLFKEALKLNPSFVSFEYRKEQLWGDKLQKATQKLFKSQDLEMDIDLAREYIKFK